MKKRSLFLQSISLLIIALLVLSCVHYLLLPKNYDEKLDLDYPYSYCMWKEFYKMEEDSLEIISLGSSHSNCAINPLLISKGLEVDAFNLSTMGADIKQISYQLEEVLQYQRPKVVTVELFSLFELDNQKGYYAIGLQGMRLSETKYKAVSQLLPDKETENLVPIAKNHSNWKYIELPDDIFRMIKHDTSLAYNGYLLYDTIYDNEPGYTVSFHNDTPNKETALTEEQIYYLNRITEQCQAVDAKLVFVITPFFTQDSIAYTDMLDKISAIKAYCDQNQIGLLNGFEELESLNLTMDDFLDAGHMNITGAFKVSNEVTDFIEDNYGAEFDGCTWNQKEEDIKKYNDYLRQLTAD